MHKHIVEQVKLIFGVIIPADRQHIIGHFEVNPITKPACPGKLFPFDEIIAGIGGAAVKASSGFTEYIIKNGDSFWKIAQQQMGGGLKATALAAFNGLSTNSVIKRGKF